MSRLSPLGLQPASTAATASASPAGAAPPAGPRILIPDASVGVKWYVPEPDSQAAARLLDPRFALHVPDYFFTEAASVLQRKVALEGTLSESDALDVYRLLRTVPMTIHATEAFLEDAIRHGVRYRRPVYDSLYLTLAASRRGRVVTADGRLYRGVHGGPLDHLVSWVTDPL